MENITLKNQAILIDPAFAVVDQGWIISDDLAIHGGCFSGIITYDTNVIEPGKSYVVTYEVVERGSGGVYPIVAGINGINRTQTGTYTEQFDIPGNATDSTFKFYSDGDLSIGLTYVYPILEDAANSVTLGFNGDENKWTTHYPYSTEMMLKFTTSFYAFKNGGLWRQNSNEMRNNFFNEQFTSKVVFLSNMEHQKDKLWFNLRLDSKGNWSAPRITTPETDQFPNGMETRLKKGNFKRIDGKLWADILRDKNDPKYADIADIEERELKALFKGRKMQGGLLRIELECADTTEAKLSSVAVYYTEIERSF